MAEVKICMPCFRKHFGPEAKPQTFTWSAQCGACKALTPRLGLLIKCDIIADMAK